MAFLSRLALMSETASTVSSSDFKAIIDAVTSQISVGTIVEVLAVVVVACVGLVFMWWGVRKAIGAIMNGLKGRMKL